MKIAVISDIHANYPALKAVVSDAPDVDRFVCLGDMVGVMGYPRQTMDLLMSLQLEHAIKGNHDIVVIEIQETWDNNLSSFEIRITLDMLTQTHKDWIADRQSYLSDTTNSIVMAHSRPTPGLSSGLNGEGNRGVDKGDYLNVASELSNNYDFVLLGHTHEQGGMNASQHGHNVIVLNPGSVGTPFGEPARYAVIDTEQHSFNLRAISYDQTPVKQRLKQLDVPINWWESDEYRR